jgi:MFS family permease
MRRICARRGPCATPFLFTPHLWLLIAARAAQGLGAAVMTALTMAFVSDLVPRTRTGSAMGLLGAMSAIGTSLGPSLGGLLIAGLGWRTIFLINVPLGALALALAWRHLPATKDKAAAASGFDIAGTLLLGATLAAYALAMTARQPGLGGIVLLAAAGCGAVMFIVVEARVASPLVRPALFRDPLLSAGLAMSLLVATVVMTTLVVGPFYLAHALALDPAIAGLVLSAGPLVAATAGLPAGRLVDRFGESRMMTAGLAAMATGTLLMSCARPALGIPGYVAPIALISMGYALFQAANNTAVMTGIAAEQRGLVSGLLNLSRNLGFITGASWLPYLPPPPPDRSPMRP